MIGVHWSTMPNLFPYFVGVMVATLQLLGSSGTMRAWSPGAFMTPTLVNFLCKRLIRKLSLCALSTLLTQKLCLQVVVPTLSHLASTM